MCPPCRTRYRTYGTTKRAKWKAEREAFDREMAGLRVAEDERRRELGLGVSLCFLFFSIWRGLFLFLIFFTLLPFCVRLFLSSRVAFLPSFLPPDAFPPNSSAFLRSFACLPLCTFIPPVTRLPSSESFSSFIPPHLPASVAFLLPF